MPYKETILQKQKVQAIQTSKLASWHCIHLPNMCMDLRA